MAAQKVFMVLAIAAMTSAQRPFFAGFRPIGYPDVTTEADLGNRFGQENANVSTTTQRLPVEANGDRELVDRLSKLPVDKQPFWLINWQALEANRNNPQTYPLRPSQFAQPVVPPTETAATNSPVITNNRNSGISFNPAFQVLNRDTNIKDDTDIANSDAAFINSLQNRRNDDEANLNLQIPVQQRKPGTFLDLVSDGKRTEQKAAPATKAAVKNARNFEENDRHLYRSDFRNSYSQPIPHVSGKQDSGESDESFSQVFIGRAFNPLQHIVANAKPDETRTKHNVPRPFENSQAFDKPKNVPSPFKVNNDNTPTERKLIDHISLKTGGTGSSGFISLLNDESDVPDERLPRPFLKRKDFQLKPLSQPLIEAFQYAPTTDSTDKSTLIDSTSQFPAINKNPKLSDNHDESFESSSEEVSTKESDRQYVYLKPVASKPKHFDNDKTNFNNPEERHGKTADAKAEEVMRYLFPSLKFEDIPIANKNKQTEIHSPSPFKVKNVQNKNEYEESFDNPNTSAIFLDRISQRQIRRKALTTSTTTAKPFFVAYQVNTESDSNIEEPKVADRAKLRLCDIFIPNDLTTTNYPTTKKHNENQHTNDKVLLIKPEYDYYDETNPVTTVELEKNVDPKVVIRNVDHNSDIYKNSRPVRDYFDFQLQSKSNDDDYYVDNPFLDK